MKALRFALSLLCWTLLFSLWGAAAQAAGFAPALTVEEGREGSKVTTYLLTLKDGEEIDREVLHTSSYPAKAPVMAINSNALPNTAPDIPEEGGSTDGGLEEGSSEDDGVYLPEEGSDSSSEDFFIPEE